MHLDPAAPDPPRPVGDLDPGAVDGYDDVPGKESGRDRQRETEALDQAQERGIVCCPEVGEEGRGFPDKSFHLAAGHQEEE